MPAPFILLCCWCCCCWSTLFLLYILTCAHHLADRRAGAVLYSTTCVHCCIMRTASQIVAPVLYLMWSGRSNVTRVGLLHLSTFFLLLLSGSRSFGVGLNKAFNPRDLPADLPLFEGSHGDLLIIVLHKLVVDGSPKLSTLYSCFMTIIANISPYAKVSCCCSLRVLPPISVSDVIDVLAC